MTRDPDGRQPGRRQQPHGCEIGVARLYDAAASAFDAHP
jgi:hypothetical protein